MKTDNVTLSLSKAEALVLFEFLGRFNEGADPTVFEDPSEQTVLWNVECLLERQLTEPFSSEYADLVAAARNALRTSKDSQP